MWYPVIECNIKVSLWTATVCIGILRQAFAMIATLYSALALNTA